MRLRQRLKSIFWVLVAFLTVVSPSVFAQYKNEREATIPLEHFYVERQGNGVLRSLLSKLNFSLSTGFARTAFRHDLAGFGVVKQDGFQPEIFVNGAPGVRYTNWITDVADTTPAIIPGSFIVSSDTASLGFRSRMFTIPLTATVHYEFDRYRIGVGYSFDYTRIGSFEPTSFKSDIGNYEVSKPGFFMKRYFVMAGAMVYRYYEYSLVVDVNVGGYKLGRQFNSGILQKGVYFNLGATVEREFSEYFRVFARPSYEIKGYSIALPEGSPSIKHKLNAFYLNVGVTYRLPELRKCFLKSCHAQMNHAHGNREYRSRRHPFWKKQNPAYGENYPTLIKYKGKNKNKLNPY